MEINTKAKVKAIEEISINSTPEKIWNTLFNIHDWPKWNTDIKKIELQGELREGTKFKWKSGPGMITSQIKEIVPNKRLSWVGKTLGIKAIHIWEIDQRDGTMYLRTSESWQGLPARLFKSSSQKTLEKAIHTGLELIKLQSEKN